MAADNFQQPDPPGPQISNINCEKLSVKLPKNHTANPFCDPLAHLAIQRDLDEILAANKGPVGTIYSGQLRRCQKNFS